MIFYGWINLIALTLDLSYSWIIKPPLVAAGFSPRLPFGLDDL